MNRIIAFTFFLLFLAAFAFISLDGIKKKADEQQQERTPEIVNMSFSDRNWQLTDTGEVDIASDDGVFVRFGADGKVNGFAGCNGFFGSYETDGANITIGPLGATRMMCPPPLMDIEMTFMAALQDATTFEVSGNKLILTDEQGRSMTLSGVAGDGDSAR